MHRIRKYLGLLVALMSLSAAATAAMIPAEKDFVNSLNGKWRFKLEQAKSPIPETFEPFHALDYKEDSNWHDFTVPGNWEMAGYSPATYFTEGSQEGDSGGDLQWYVAG